MKFVSWNVNGLRACIQKGFLEQFDRFDADFFCLQETKLSEGQLELELPGYHQYWCYAEKKGYSGTAIFTKHKPQSVQYGLGVEELDNEGRLITLEYPEFYLVTCYTPNAQRGLARIDHRMTWDDAFRSYLQRLDAVKPVILCGDLNVAHKEIDLKNPASNRGNAGFSDEERESFQKTLDLGFTDTFRHLHPDQTGAYSWWSYMYHARQNNAGWRIDYFLASERLKDVIYQAEIHSQILGSDHCPVFLDLSIPCNGGIWSPLSQGSARQTFPAPKTENKKTKASATSAKATVFLSCVLFLLMGAFLLWKPPANPTPTVTDPTIIPPSFAVHVYNQPITHVQEPITYPAPTVITLENQFTDGNEIYYSISSLPADALDDCNAWVRVDAPSPDTHPAALTYESPFDKNFLSHKVQYYTDEACKNFGGWLIFFRLNQSTRFIFRLEGAKQQVTLVPISDQFTPMEGALQIRAFTTEPSFYDYTDDIRHISAIDFEAYAEHMDPNVPISDCNSWFYITLTPEAEALWGDEAMDLTSVDDFPDYDSQYQLPLVICKVYEDVHCKLFSGWLAYGDLEADSMVTFILRPDTAPHRILCTQQTQAIPFMEREEAEMLSTADLLEYLSLHIGIHELLDIYTTSVLSEDILQELPIRYPALSVFLSRTDAISVAMDANYTDTTQRLVVNILLKEYLKDAMSPKDLAAYIIGDFPCASVNSFPEFVRYSDISSLSTDNLLNLALDYFTVNILDGCTTNEAKYYIMQYYFSRNCFWAELLKRDNAWQCMAANDRCPQTLTDVWEYIVARDEAENVTGQVLVDRILSDQALCDVIKDPLFTKQDIYNYATLSALMSKRDAVYSLMNATPTESWAKDIPTILLGDFMMDLMTVNELANFLLGRYATSPQRFALSYDSDGSEDTAVLAERVKDSYDLMYLFLEIPGNRDYHQVCFEIYKLLVPESNLLKELESRSDALAYLRLYSLYAGHTYSPVTVLLNLYENYPIQSGEKTGLSMLDASNWSESQTAMGNTLYTTGSLEIYASGYGRSPLEGGETFVQFITLPQNQYSSDILTITATQLEAPNAQIYLIPCYINSSCTDFAGWLIYGDAAPGSIISISICANNVAIMGSYYFVPEDVTLE